VLHFYKFSFLTLIAFSFFSNFIQKTFASDTFFIVTAYYSPIANQKSYISWSYYWDIKLNGAWKITSSWKPVYSGLLAAPKNYSFGTKIELEWIWILEVNDRGWSIVKASSWVKYDRIDVWVWYGDEWLKKAIAWWKRTVAWRIIETNWVININYNSDTNNWTNLNINPNSSKEDVKLLQNLFKQNNIYFWEINWDYESFKWTIIDFQKQSGIIKDNSDWWAWYFWKQTKTAFLNKYWENSLTIKKENKEIEIEGKQDEIKIDKDILLVKKIERYIEKESLWDEQKKEELISKIKFRLESLEDKELKNKIAYLSESI